MRILIIEDEKKVHQFLRKGFLAEAFTVDVATDGEAGSERARTETYDAIILDIMLPKKDGFTVLQEIRAAHVATPIVILSAKHELEDRVLGLNLGADYYLPKPFSFSEVLASVRTIVRRQSVDVQASVLTVGDLRIDLLSRHVERSGEEIQLTAKEFELLEYLIRNKGRVLSRVTLMEHIWDINFDSETNVVDVVINRLRRKIDDRSQVKLIHTVRGAGYAIREPSDEPAHDN
jgi:two-component system copper resistance phosphate regulon response regulator CusR